MDVLTDILRTVHLGGSVYCRPELSAPWGIAMPASRDAQFHVLRQGRCWLHAEVPGAEPLALEAGDLVVLPHGAAHVIADSPSTHGEPIAQLLAGCPAGGRLQHGGGGEPAVLICGRFTFEASAVHPLLTVLPPVLVVRGEGGRARSWLESTLDLIEEECLAGRPGREALVDRLTEVTFIQALRSHLQDQRQVDPSWLAGLRDPQIARALEAIHAEPRARWTVQELGSKVGMSRSAFSARFAQVVGEPPLSYLIRWRMQLAAGHLRSSRLSMLEIAERVGYVDEASFGKVFKRLWGVPPAAFRRRASGGEAEVGLAS